MNKLLGLTLLLSVCHCARQKYVPSTTTALPTLPTIPPQPVDSVMTLTVELHPTDMSPTCEDATSTTNPLGRLRSAMRNTFYTQRNIFFDGFLVFYSDEHLSEEPAPEERRLEYISGWDGAGMAAVIADGGAAVWVPSGDVKRARATMSCAWLVLDADDPSQPTVAEWMTERLGRAGRVGADSRLTSVVEWQSLTTILQREGLQLVHVPTMVDQLWNEEQDPERRRPEFSRIVANQHNALYTGLTWREKVEAVRNELRVSGADAMVVTALDEVAWLLNVRGRDLPHARLLKAFVIISSSDVRVYAPQGKLSMPLREALGAYNCYMAANNCTRVNDTANVYADLRRMSESKILIPAAGTFQRGASAAIAQSVPQTKRLYQLSPIIYLKAQKNQAEVNGMRRAHLRDAVAMCTLLSYLEGIVKTGLTEQSVAMKVDITRATQPGFVGVSMKTRVSFGPSAAEPDYRPTEHTNRRVYKNSTLVIQSGGQYDEGTTLVTRTLHYGTPSREERRAYTTNLRAMAAFSMLLIPATLPAAHTDPVVRAPLWAAKLDYVQPTGHGVGAALNRREDPVVIDYRQDTNLHTFKENYFINIEPAWYDPNSKFGIKLGNVLEVVAKPHGYLGFNESTLLPYEPKLIDKSMLTEYEINWLNAYNERIRKIVGPDLKDLGLTDVYYWMMNKTVHVEPPSKIRRTTNSEANLRAYVTLVVVLCFALFF